MGEFEPFWDPSSDLAAIRIPSREAGQALDEFGVFSARAKGDKKCLLAIANAKANDAWCIVHLPPGHRFLCVQSLQGDAEIADAAEFILVPDVEVTSGSFVVAIASTLGTQNSIHVRPYPAIVEEDQLFRQILSVWGDGIAAISCHRKLPQPINGGPSKIGPTKLLWPNNRIYIEPLPFPQGGGWEAAGPAAVHQHSATEVAPRVQLRLSMNLMGDAQRSTRYVSIVHVLQQRRFFERIKQQRQRPFSSRVAVEPLPLDTIREWLSDWELHFEAVESNESIIVRNLGELLSLDDETGEIACTVSKDLSYVDIEFACASLGDDVGLLFNDRGERPFLVRRKDPGGDPGIRLFRVGIDELEPRPIEHEEPLFLEVHTQAVLKQRDVRTDGLRLGGLDKWQQYIEGLGLPHNIEQQQQRLTALSPIVLASWAEVVRESRFTDAESASAFKAFTRLPSLLSALARVPHIYEGADFSFGSSVDDTFCVLEQIAELVAARDVVKKIESPRAWGFVWRVIREPGLLTKFKDARLRIDEKALNFDVIRKAAEELWQEERVNLALECSLDRDLRADAASLEAYLERRRSQWIDVSTIGDVPEIVSNLLSDNFDVQGSPAGGSTEPDDERDFGTLLRDVEKLLDQALQRFALDKELKAQALEFHRRKKSRTLDRRVLRLLEKRWRALLGNSEIDDKAVALAERLETWAGLPGFAEKMAARLERGSTKVVRPKLQLIGRIANRVAVPKLEASNTEFNRVRQELSSRVATTLTGQASQSMSSDVVRDVAKYADILLHHRAFQALRNVAVEESGEAISLTRRLQAWPSEAAEIWAVARRSASGPAAQDLTEALSLPTGLTNVTPTTH